MWGHFEDMMTEGVFFKAAVCGRVPSLLLQGAPLSNPPVWVGKPQQEPQEFTGSPFHYFLPLPGRPPGGLDQQSLCSHLELSGLGHVLDAFEGFILLPIHVQPVHLQPCAGTQTGLNAGGFTQLYACSFDIGAALKTLRTINHVSHIWNTSKELIR